MDWGGVMVDLDKDFKELFPKLNFTLKDFQKKVIENVISKGNTLCVMPTGGGKSVIYWMTAAELKGIAIVISPLIALIDEQAAKLEEQGYEVLVLHSGISVKNQVKLMSDFANGNLNPQFIFVSPEKLATDGFFEACVRERKSDIKLLVIDEVHCVSQWGENFRPFYKRIPDFLNQIYGADNWIKILALTATINPKETADICSAFNIEKNNVISCQEKLIRSDIQLHVQKFSNEIEKEEEFWNIINLHIAEKILVYIYRKKHTRGVEDLCEKAIEKGLKAEFFHGEMTAKERAEVADRFRSGETQIIFATNAFGMGMDIPDIRTVIHFMIPESVEQYYQEIGRAGRDGNCANAYLLYSNKNIEVKHKDFIDQSFPSEENLIQSYHKIAGKNTGFRPISLFDNDEDIQECFHYFQRAPLLQVECKGFMSLRPLTDIQNDKIQQFVDSTRSKYLISVLNKYPDLTPREIIECIYQAFIEGSVKSKNPLDRCLILNINQTEIDQVSMQEILADIEQKKTYRQSLLDYLVYLIEHFEESNHLHQDIAYYLGVDKFKLGKIYTTADGNRVRSKSEVIISDLLYKSGINYTYEQKLHYGSQSDQCLLPDFTIHLPDGTDLYWEHVGMLGIEDYDKRWQEKLKIYQSQFPDKLIRTYESAVLSKHAENIIQKLKNEYGL